MCMCAHYVQYWRILASATFVLDNVILMCVCVCVCVSRKLARSAVTAPLIAQLSFLTHFKGQLL